MTKNNGGINSMLTSIRPSNNASFKEKPSSTFIQKKGSINQVKDINLNRHNSKKKNYTMDSKSTQTELNIIRKDIKFITVNMLNMNLRVLNLSDNKIIYLPDEICDLNQLTTITVDKNNLKEIPHEIGQLYQLKIVNFSYNDIRIVPESLGNCKNLTDLSLNDNKIELLPRTIGNCDKLTTILIQNNLIYALPRSLAELNNLNILSLEWFQYFDPP